MTTPSFALESERAAENRAFVARALTDAEGRPGFTVIAVPAPFAPLSEFLRAAPRDLGVLWQTPNEPRSFATAGAAYHITLSGRERFTALRRALATVFASFTIVAAPGCPEVSPPRVFGGFAFEPETNGGVWERFGDGSFTLPRWIYARGDDDATITLTVDGRRDCTIAGRHALLEEYDLLMEALEAYEGESTMARASVNRYSIPPSGARHVRQLEFPRWEAHIQKVRAAILSGRFSKIVAARHAEVTLNSVIDDIEVLSRLAAEPHCTRFAFRRADASFIGASPESLFVKTGRELNTQALAGTLRSLGSEYPILTKRSSQLLTSTKDLHEHEIVVQQIRGALQPFSAELRVPSGPQVSKIRNILHLNTQIGATLHEGVTVPDLVEALHPTPAVGGLPKREAAQWISQNEPQQRGWYTGTVGWVNAAGDGAFIVAIRSGLIRFRSAYVYAGAGIVAQSDAAAEYAETELKQLPMLRALGVV